MEPLSAPKRQRMMREFIFRNLHLLRTLREQDVLVLRYGAVSGPNILDWEDIGAILQVPEDIAESFHCDALRTICRLSGEDVRHLLLETPQCELSGLKHRARKAARRAIKFGHLTPHPCEECGAPETEAHHSDYRYPLSVNWLCKRCHAAAHVRIQHLGDGIVTSGVISVVTAEMITAGTD